jgi:hypothetical protein
MTSYLDREKFNKFSKSPFYKSLTLFPGNLLLDKWQESKKTMWDTLDSLEKEDNADLIQIGKWREEIKSKNDVNTWVQYITGKYVDILKGIDS